MSLFHKDKFARGLLLRVAVSRQTDLQGSATVSQTRQDSHVIPQQNQANFDRPFFKCDNNLEHDPYSYFQWADQEPNEYTVALNQPCYLPPPLPSPVQPFKITKKKPKSQAATTIERNHTHQGHLLDNAPQTHPSAQKRAEGAKEQEKQGQPITAARDRHHHCLARRQQYPRPWYSVYTPRTPKH